MNVWLGLQRLTGRRAHGERYVVEEERYDDLRDVDGMIDLSEYAALHRRHYEAVSYVDLDPTTLDHDARRRAQIDGSRGLSYDDLDDFANTFGDLRDLAG